MKKRTWETLALVASTTAALALPGLAQATALPLQNAVITATYNGQAAGMQGRDSNFQAGAGSNVTAIDPADFDTEYISSDFNFIFDFSTDGKLAIYNNSGAALGPGAYSFRFDFGASLAAPITAVGLLGAGTALGAPVFSILDGGYALNVDLGNVSWDGSFDPVTASIEAASVPEPGTLSVLLAGAGAIALVRRRRKPLA